MRRVQRDGGCYSAVAKRHDAQTTQCQGITSVRLLDGSSPDFPNVRSMRRSVPAERLVEDERSRSSRGLRSLRSRALFEIVGRRLVLDERDRESM
jgi:hypothetical protein